MYNTLIVIPGLKISLKMAVFHLLGKLEFPIDRFVSLDITGRIASRQF
jgi:hypothetical protein